MVSRGGETHPALPAGTATATERVAIWDAHNHKVTKSQNHKTTQQTITERHKHRTTHSHDHTSPKTEEAKFRALPIFTFYGNFVSAFFFWFVGHGSDTHHSSVGR